MPLGLNRNGDFRNGSPITLPHNFGNPVNTPVDFGNDVTLPLNVGNPVTWLPNPAHFGNIIGPTTTPLAAPVAAPAGGSYTSAQSVTLTTDPNATATYYTTDGSTPTTSSTLYSGPITTTGSGTEVIKAFSHGTGLYSDSPVMTATYVITASGPAFVAASPVAVGTEFGTGPVTTTPIDTTDANFITIVVTSFDSTTANIAISDSKGNMWTSSAFTGNGGNQGKPLFWHCLNPIVGAGHTFTATGTVDGTDSIAAIAFSGVTSGAPENPLSNNFNSANSASFTVATAPQTPASTNDILVAGVGMGFYTGPMTAMIDSEYIIAAQSLPSAYLGVVFAYKFATSGDVSGGSNPTVTLTGGSTPSPASVLGIYAK